MRRRSYVLWSPEIVKAVCIRHDTVVITYQVFIYALFCSSVFVCVLGFSPGGCGFILQWFSRMGDGRSVSWRFGGELCEGDLATDAAGRARHARAEGERERDANMCGWSCDSVVAHFSGYLFAEGKQVSDVLLWECNVTRTARLSVYQVHIGRFFTFFTPRTNHELAHLSCIAQALKTCADELPPIAQAGGNMCSSCSSYSSSRGQMS